MTFVDASRGTAAHGPIGNGVCDSTNPCQVIVNDASLTDAEATVRIPITLAD